MYCLFIYIIVGLDEVIDDRIAEEQDQNLIESESNQSQNRIEPVPEPESNVDLLSEELNKATSLENV